MSINNSINIHDYIDFYIKRTAHSKQARKGNLRPEVQFGNLSLHNWIVLPEYNGLQHMLGAFVNSYPENQGTTDYGFRYRFRKAISQGKGVELSVRKNCYV